MLAIFLAIRTLSLMVILTTTTSFIGSITLYGKVLIAFHNQNNITHGFGKVQKIDGKWQFIMQLGELNGTGTVIGLSHWSYMIKINPNDDSYQHLPGINISVPQAISNSVQ